MSDNQLIEPQLGAQPQEQEIQYNELDAKSQYLGKIPLINKIPYIVELTEAMDNHIGSGLKMISPVASSLVEKKNELSQSVAEFCTGNVVTQKLNDISKSLIQCLEEEINKIAKGYNIKNNVFDAEYTNDLNLYRRGLFLLHGINQVTNVMADYYADNFSQLGCVQFADRSFLEMRVFALICADLAKELVVGGYSNLAVPLTKNLLIEPYQLAINGLSAAKEKIVLDLKKWKDNKFPVIMPLWEFACKNATILKEGTINFYQNYISIEFAKNFYDENKETIINALKDFYASVQDSLKNSLQTVKRVGEIKKSTQELYETAVADYKKRRQEKLKKLIPVNEQIIIEIKNQNNDL